MTSINDACERILQVEYTTPVANEEVSHRTGQFLCGHFPQHYETAASVLSHRPSRPITRSFACPRSGHQLSPSGLATVQMANYGELDRPDFVSM